MPGPDPATLDPRIYTLNLPLGFGGAPVPYMDPETIAAYGALQRRYREEMDSLLRTEADIPVAYESSIADLARNREDSIRGVGETMADRGLTHSGINVGEQSRVHEDYNRQLNAAATAKTKALEEVARKKLSTLLGFNEGSAGLFRQGIATGVSSGVITPAAKPTSPAPVAPKPTPATHRPASNPILRGLVKRPARQASTAMLRPIQGAY